MLALVPQHNMLLRDSSCKAQLQRLVVVVAHQRCCLLHVACCTRLCILLLLGCLSVNGREVLLAAWVLGSQHRLDRGLQGQELKPTKLLLADRLTYVLADFGCLCVGLAAVRCWSVVNSNFRCCYRWCCCC